jgi:hypothetical protein
MRSAIPAREATCHTGRCVSCSPGWYRDQSVPAGRPRRGATDPAAEGLTALPRPISRRGPTAGAFHDRGVRGGEAELPVQAVRVGGVQQPSESFPRPVFDHLLPERPAKPASAVILQDVHVGEVGQRHSVGKGAGESDHVPLAVIAADDPPGALDSASHIFA